MNKEISSDQWLVRTHDNWIAGRYTTDQVRDMITSHKLTAQDEVCTANSYWIYLNETDLIRKFLGIRVPKEVLGGVTEEETTETSIDRDRTDPELEPKVSAPHPTIPTKSDSISQSSPLKRVVWILVILGAVGGYLLWSYYLENLPK